MADRRGEAEIADPGPRWIKIPARGAVRIVPIGPKFAGMAPAFQTDPAVPVGSVRVFHSARSVELHNALGRPVSVFLVFLRSDTIESIAMLAKSAKSLKEIP